MPSLRTGYSCPSCKRFTGDTNEIVAEGRILKCSKVPEHQWADMQDFLDLKPTIEFKMEQQKSISQPNHTPITVNVPVRVKNAIQSRFGEKADSTVAGVLSMMAEGEVLVVGESDLQRLTTALRERPKNGSHLYGMVYALTEEIKEAKQVSETAESDLKAYEGINVGRVLVNLGNQYATAVEKANSENLPTKVWLERAVINALENSWF